MRGRGRQRERKMKSREMKAGVVKKLKRQTVKREVALSGKIKWRDEQEKAS